MESGVFINLAAVMIVATVVSIVMRLLSQPLIIGYILTGVIVGPNGLALLGSDATVGALSQFGVALLLFLVGIGLDPKVIKEFGKTSVVSGFGQVAITSALGLALALAMGFTWAESVYISVAFTLSSTIIIMKLLSDRNELETLHGKISMGILLMQDLVALIALIVVSSFSDGGDIWVRVIEAVSAGVLLVGVLAAVSVYALPRVLKFIASSQELLFIFAIGWLFLVATLFGLSGFSIEMGALLAGVAVSLSPYKYEMSAKVKPLRDFFVLIFFVLLGVGIDPSQLKGSWPAVALFTGFILFIDPLIVIVILNRIGYAMRTAFLTGLTMAQVSEFSFILVGIGASLGHVRPETAAFVTTVGLITIAASAYMIPRGGRIYERCLPFLRLICSDKGKTASRQGSLAPAQVVLFGHNRIGHDLLKAIRKAGKSVLVVDYNPDVMRHLENEGVRCIYGDANDQEMLAGIDLERARMVISTIPVEDTNRILIHSVRRRNKKAIFIGVSHQIDEALRIYKAGASYVLLPHFLGGTFAADLITRHGFAKHKFHKEKAGHLRSLNVRKKMGHDHPRISDH